MRDSREFFYRVGIPQDADLHEPILAEGDDEAARAVSRAVMKRLGINPDHLLPNKSKKQFRAYDESEHPRDEHGRWTDAGGTTEAAEGEKLLLVSQQPNLEKLTKWHKQIEDRQKEIADQKQSGNDEDNELYKMKSALENFEAAKPADIDSDRAGLNTVYDGDQKLLATVWTSYKSEIGIANVEIVGAIDDDAKLKALQQTIKRYGDKAERIQAYEWDDNKESIAIFEQAGFKIESNIGGQVQLISGKAGMTEKEKENEKVVQEKHAAEILGAGKATAKLAGYDPDKIETSDEVYNFKIGERSGYTAAGIAHLQTGQITLYPKSIHSTNAAVSVTVHEVAHQKYQTVLNAIAEDRKKLAAELTANPGLGDAIMNPDGTFKPAFKEIYEKKYPIYTRFLKHEGDAFHKRIDADGITDYSKAYWEPAAVKQYNGIEIASHETIAEMARLVVDKGSTGAKPVWRSYYKDVMKTYDELKKAKE